MTAKATVRFSERQLVEARAVRLFAKERKNENKFTPGSNTWSKLEKKSKGLELQAAETVSRVDTCNNESRRLCDRVTEFRWLTPAACVLFVQRCSLIYTVFRKNTHL